MSALSTLVSLPGTVIRRFPGNRLRSLAAGLAGTRVKYLIPPLVALIVVVGVQVFGAANQPAAAPAPLTADVAHHAGDVADPVPVTEVLSVGAVDTSDIDRRIEFWRGRLASGQQSENEWIYLGDLFDIKGRQTGDITQFVAAREAYAKAVEIAPNSSEAHAGAARIMATLHDFAGALAQATTVLELDPYANGALGVVFDASLELGQIDNARLALERLADRVQTPAVTIRQARLHFLTGDTAGAAGLARDAVAEAAGAADAPSTVAFYQYSAAEYALLSGDLDAAWAGYAAALESLPGYPLAIFGEGRVAYARGDLPLATSRLETAVAALPRPDMLAFLGDLYTLKGDSAKAADQYATVGFIAEMTASSAGAVYDREYALYLADHGQNAALALTLANAESAVREDVYAYDTLAWALHANGQQTEALSTARTALAKGTVDARVLIHAGLIELANGLTAEGQAHLRQGLDLRPAFSPIVVEKAREAVAP